MNVRMVLQGLAPAMHHRDDADLGAEMTRIGGDRAQRLGRGAEKNGVNRRLILECDCGDLGRYGEDDVEIRHRKQFGLPVGEPLGAREPLALWAMPVAAGNGHRPLPALWANSVMGSWCT